MKVRLSLDDLSAIAPSLEGSALASWIRQAALEQAKKDRPPGTDTHP